MSQLYSWVLESGRLPELAARAAIALGEPAVALLMSPQRAWLTDITELTASADPSRPNDEHDDVFEARCFGPNAELRWLRDRRAGEPTGTGVLLAEDPSAVDGLGQVPEPTIMPLVETLANRYLLWGDAVGSDGPSGTSVLHSTRIGQLQVPLDLDPGQSVYLATIEYVAVDGHGNAYVVDERLTGLEPGGREEPKMPEPVAGSQV